MIWGRIAALGLAALLAFGGCNDDDERGEASAAATTPAPEPPPDAGPTPDAEAAAEVLRRFTTAVASGDLQAARADLRLPPGVTDEDIDRFLRQLVEDEHLSVAGADAVIASGHFGPLSDRFGESAAHVATNAGLALEKSYAFGDADASAVLVWSGTRFYVAAVHNLVSLEPSGE